MVNISEFGKIELKTARILSADFHPDAERLLVLTIDVGEESPRQIVAGIRETYAPGELLGRQIVVVSNLEPAVIRGVKSEGMLLACKEAGKMSLLTPDKLMKPGLKIS